MERRQFLGAAALATSGLSLPSTTETTDDSDTTSGDGSAVAGFLHMNATEEATCSVEAYANDPEYQAGVTVETDLFDVTVLLGSADVARLVEELNDAQDAEGVSL